MQDEKLYGKEWRIEQIKDRLKAATPWPWIVVSDCTHYAIAQATEENPGMRRRVVETHENQTNGPHHRDAGGIENERNAAFIANAPDDVAWLLDQLAAAEAREAENAALRAKVARVEAEANWFVKLGEENLEYGIGGSVTLGQARLETAKAILAALKDEESVPDDYPTATRGCAYGCCPPTGETS